MSREKDSSRDDLRRRPRPRPERSGSGDYRRARQPRASRDVPEDSSQQPGRRPPIQRRLVPPRKDRYQETRPPIARSRQTRNFREEEEMFYRQRRPQSSNPRDYTDESYTRTPMRREINTEGEHEDRERPVRRSGTRPLPPPPHRAQPARRRIGSTLLIGFIGGIITLALIVGVIAFLLFRVLPNSFPGLGIGTSTFTDKPQAKQFDITNITQLQIQNQVGNLSITVDSNATTGRLMYTRKTKATSSSSAATEFGRIAVNVQQGNSTGCSASCLTISTTIPANSVDSVDMNVVLPMRSLSTHFKLSSTIQNGNISVQSFNGLLNLTDDTGNVNVQGGLLDAGSCLQTRLGNVTFAGALETADPPTINPCIGNPIPLPTPGTSQNSQPWYKLISGTGNVDVTLVTLGSQLAGVTLDATVNNKGQIISAYPIAIVKNADGSESYFGPLLPGNQPSAQLTLSVDTGNITLRKG